MELDSMISREFGACHTVCVSSYHARITKWFIPSCSLFFSNRATILKLKSPEVCCYISVRTVPIMFDISLASYWGSSFASHHSYVLICQLHTMYHLLVWLYIIANITKQHPPDYKSDTKLTTRELLSIRLEGGSTLSDMEVRIVVGVDTPLKMLPLDNDRRVKKPETESQH